MNSRSEMRRLAVQKPDALIAEIERLRAFADREHARLDEAVKVGLQLEAENARLREALEEIIRMNQQYAVDRYGDVARADGLSCVRVARAALAGGGAG